MRKTIFLILSFFILVGCDDKIPLTHLFVLREIPPTCEGVAAVKKIVDYQKLKVKDIGTVPLTNVRGFICMSDSEYLPFKDWAVRKSENCTCK